MYSRAGANSSAKPGKKSDLVHPFLFAMYPAFHIYVYNIRKVGLPDVVRPLAFSLVLAVVCLALASCLLRRRAKAGLFTSFFLITFLSYGHVVRMVCSITPYPAPTIDIAGFFLWSALVLSFFVLLMRTRRDLSQLGRLALALGSVLVALLAVKALSYAARPMVSRKDGWQAMIAAERRSAREMSAKAADGRDIYLSLIHI